MTVQKSRARASTLTQLIGQVIDAFSATADATPVLVGRKHLGQGGCSPRIVFVPENGSGSIGPAMFLGHRSSCKHSCTVSVRAAESGDDLTRIDATYDLMDRVVCLIKIAGTGKVEFGGLRDDSPADVDVFGAGLSFDFTFSRDIVHDTKRWSLPPATEDSTRTPSPPGIPIDGLEIVPTVSPKE